MQPKDEPFDASWEAFRYITGEMTAEEVASFESRLTHDHSLCEAVERAVELTQAIYVAESTARTEISTNSVLPAATANRVLPVWASFMGGALACFIAIFGWQSLQSYWHFHSQISSQPIALAELWSKALPSTESLLTEDASDIAFSESLSLQNEFTGVEYSEADFVLADQPPPSWMLEAITIPSESLPSKSKSDKTENISEMES